MNAESVGMNAGEFPKMWRTLQFLVSKLTIRDHLVDLRTTISSDRETWLNEVAATLRVIA
jgi:hypothetical protein